MIWNFRIGGENIGPKDAAIKEFSKHIFESIVREAVQNSLDVPSDDGPVVVRFAFSELEMNSIPGYEDLLKHYRAMADFWGGDRSYKPIFESIDKRVTEFGYSIPILTISDHHTTGMHLEAKQGIRKSKYFAFSRGNNSVHDTDDSGGSEGQGKATLYAASALRTIYIHTISEKGSIYEGLTRLATHNLDGIDYSANGHLFQDMDKPAYETADELEMPFRRNPEDGFGTSISIIGLWKYDNVKEKMIKAALNNFWLAIYEGELVVQVQDVEINKDNVERLILHYLPERNESSWTKSNPTDYGKARCYFETWTEKSEQTEVYKESIPVLGNCVFKISFHDEFPGKIAFFRKQKMLIVRSGANRYIVKGHCGVFICLDKDGNEILRSMEGKTHTEWDPNFYREDVERGVQAIHEMNEFIKRSWTDYRAKYLPETIDLKGMSGLTIGGQGTGGTVSVKPIIQPKPVTPKTPKVRAEYKKMGVINGGLKSILKDYDWVYSLSVNSNADKKIRIEVIPASDSVRISKSEYLKITSAKEGWTIENESELVGRLAKGNNELEFKLDAPERMGLDFKFSYNEV